MSAFGKPVRFHWCHVARLMPVALAAREMFPPNESRISEAVFMGRVLHYDAPGCQAAFTSSRVKSLPMHSTFAKRLRETRKTCGLTLEQLASKAGCTRSLLAQYERGLVAECKMVLLYAIADALRVNGRWLAIGLGTRDRVGPVTDEERNLLVAYRLLPKEVREHFIRSAESIASATHSVPTVVNPFPKAKPAAKS